MNATTATDRVAISLPEARLELGLSQRQLAALSGISRNTIARVERGGRIDPALLVRLGATLMVLDTYQPPPPLPTPALPVLATPRLAVLETNGHGEPPPLPYEIEVDGARQWVAPAAAGAS